MFGLTSLDNRVPLPSFPTLRTLTDTVESIKINFNLSLAEAKKVFADVSNVTQGVSPYFSTADQTFSNQGPEKLEAEAVARRARDEAEAKARLAHAASVKQQREILEKKQREQQQREKEESERRETDFQRRQAENLRAAEEAAKREREAWEAKQAQQIKEEREREKFRQECERKEKERQQQLKEAADAAAAAEVARRKAQEEAAKQSRIDLYSDEEVIPCQQPVAPAKAEEAEGEQTKLFDNVECYKIENQQTGRWYFWNNSNMELHVQWSFGPTSTIKALGDATMTIRGSDKWFVVDCVIYPGQTKPFIEGKPNGWKSSYSTKALSDSYKTEIENKSRKIIDAEVAAVKAKAGPTTDEEAILQACLLSNTPYVDLNFQPQRSSLFRKGLDDPLDPLPWLRPSAYLPGSSQGTLFRNMIEPNDIDQGHLGDCWLLCSISAVAEFSTLVRGLFRHPLYVKDRVRARNMLRKEQALGAFRVTINKHGWWNNMILDNYLPAITSPVFCRNNEEPDELWVSLLEKAYAKLHGSYSTIVSGDALFAMEDLTGYPITRFDEEELRKDDGTLFRKLLAYDKEGHIITISTPGQDDSAYMTKAGQANNSAAFMKRYKDAGLGLGHAYTILSAVESEGFRLVCVRNPWGNGTEWTGAWGDEDDRWKKYPNTARACNFTAGPNGIFWMGWEDVKKYFDGGGVCHVKRDWIDYRVRNRFVNGEPELVLEVTVTQRPITMYFILSQRDPRGLAENNPLHKKYAVSLALCSPQNANIQKVTGYSPEDSNTLQIQEGRCVHRVARSVAFARTFEPNINPYLIVPRCHSTDKGSRDFVLGVIAERPLGGAESIRFVKLPEKCPLLHNYVEFPYEAAKAVTKDAEYQCRLQRMPAQFFKGRSIATL